MRFFITTRNDRSQMPLKKSWFNLSFFRLTQAAVVLALLPTGSGLRYGLAAGEARSSFMHRLPADAHVDGQEAQGDARTRAARTPEIQFAQTKYLPVRMDLSTETTRCVLVGTPLEETQHEHIRGLLKGELDRYPAEILCGSSMSILRQVFVFDSLTINGQSVAGTYWIGMVFLAVGANPPPGLERDACLVRALHQEISRLLWMRYSDRFDEKRFRELLPIGFEYVDDAPSAGASSASSARGSISTLEDLAQGFVSPTAKQSLKSDLGFFAELLLTEPELLPAILSPTSRAARKAAVVRDFYIAIDPRFKEMFECQPH